MSLDLKMTKAEARDKMLTAMREQDQDAFTEGLEAFGEAIIADLQTEMETLRLTADQNALAARGKKPLTGAELKFAKDFKALASQRLEGKNVTAALSGIHMPDETLDLIFDDITVDHPLLNYIDFQNTSFATKWLMSKNTYQKALWGGFDAEVTKEIAASFSEKDMTQLSLTAFIPVSRGLLDLGPDWIYRYVVAILREAIANGLEDGAINNLNTSTGPIGMLADLTKGTSGTDGAITYTAKTKKAVTKLDPETYGTILGELATTDNENTRAVDRAIMIINPKDYFTKVFPAITVQGVNGTYVQNALPFPTTFVQSAACPQNTAICYLPNGYWMGLGQAGNAGTIEQSDEYKFLERKRYYMIYLYANGQPKDNHVCVPLNITNLKPATIATTSTATVAGTVSTKEVTTGTGS